MIAEFTSANGDYTVTREVRSVNGAVQAEPNAFIGMPAGATLESLKVQWADGSVQDLEQPENNRLGGSSQSINHGSIANVHQNHIHWMWFFSRECSSFIE